MVSNDSSSAYSVDIMHVFLHLIFPFGIYRTVCSSPVPPNAIKSRAELPLLVLLLTFVSLLFILFFTKWFYIIWRRQAKKAGGSRTTLRSGWYDNLSTSSSRFGKVFLGSSDVKSGFLIGLLGSPSWETRYSAVIADHHSPLRDSSVSSCKSAPGLSFSQSRKSCSSLCCPSARSPVPEEKTPLVNNPRAISPPPPAVTINRSPLLSDIEYMRLLNYRISAVCVSKASRSSPSISSGGTIQVGHPSNESPVTHPSTPKSLKDPSLDTDVSLRSQEHETQKPLPVALPLTNIVPHFERTLPNINEHSSDSNQSQSAGTIMPFPPSFRSRTMHPTKHLPSLLPNRKSPKIGPSPLRTMFLPPDGHPDSFQTLFANQHGHRVRPPAHGAIDIVENLVWDRAKNVRLSSTLSPSLKESTDADSLLDLMSELAQETSAWDSNVFMDENFKKLVSLEPLNPQAGFKEQTVRSSRRSWRSSRHRKIQHVFTTLEDIPEVDVADMMPAPTGDTFIRSFWSDGGVDR